MFAEKLCGKERPSTKLVFRCSTQKQIITRKWNGLQNFLARNVFQKGSRQILCFRLLDERIQNASLKHRAILGFLLER